MFVGLVLALVNSLVVGACTLAVPTTEEEVAEEIVAKVYRWRPATWINKGIPWDFLVYLSEYINEESDGRIVSVPSVVGAVAPVEKQMEAVSDGITPAMLPSLAYYAGKIPLASVYNTSIGLPSALDMYIAYEIFEGGRASELYYGECERLYNVHVVGERIGPVEAILSTTVSIPRIDDLYGLKFRCDSEHFVVALNAFGAFTVWSPGNEIYTMMDTNVIDGFTYGSAYDHYVMNFNEVTTCWQKTSIMAANNEQFVVNRDIWNEMPDDLKKMVEVGIQAAVIQTTAEAYLVLNDTWVKVEAEGIEIVEWSAEDIKRWVAVEKEWARQFAVDPVTKEFLDIIDRYGESIGL